MKVGMKAAARRAWLLLAALALAGCTATASSRAPAPAPAPPPHSQGRGWAWGRANPRLAPIPGTSIQYVEDTDEDVFLFGGVWYRCSGGLWFSCRTYGGEWARVKAPPAEFERIPPGHAKARVKPGRGPGPKPARGPKKR